MAFGWRTSDAIGRKEGVRDRAPRGVDFRKNSNLIDLIDRLRDTMSRYARALSVGLGLLAWLGTTHTLSTRRVTILHHTMNSSFSLVSWTSVIRVTLSRIRIEP